MKQHGSEVAAPGQVYLVGAGPGDPDLLTLRAARLIATADILLPDDLVSAAVLDMASPTAKIVPVGKRCGQPRITQAEIHELMIRHASWGRSVVRLKSGDPLVFGRAGEEIAALRGAEIPFEIVPGISAAFAVAARLKTPLTDRTAASKLILATAHHAAGKLSLTPSWQGGVSGRVDPGGVYARQGVRRAVGGPDRCRCAGRHSVRCRVAGDDRRGDGLRDDGGRACDGGGGAGAPAA